MPLIQQTDQLNIPLQGIFNWLLSFSMERTSNNFSVYFFSSPTRLLILYTNYLIRDGLFPLFFVIFPNLFDPSCEENKQIIKSVILKR